MLALLLVACATRNSGGRLEEQATSVSAGEGYALVVPVEARVESLGNGVRVDAADGSRWFDVRRVSPPETPQEAIDTFADSTCDAATWETPVFPVDGTSVKSGTCPINGRRHWLLAIVEDRPDGPIVSVYAADAALLTLEDAWVDVTRTMLTLGPGPDPLVTPSPDEVQRRMRSVAASGGIGLQPVPGGGTLSGATATALSDVFVMRKQAAEPFTDAAPR